MSDIAIPVIAISDRRDDVEFYNKALRDAGHAVRCVAISRIEDLGAALESEAPHLIIFFADAHAASIGDIAEFRQAHSPMSRLIVVAENADEAAISDAMLAGAEDLVSIGQRQRLCAVSRRELKAFRLERSLDQALKSAMQYRQQLKSVLSNSADAIAVVQEGIVVEANQAWAELFAAADVAAAHGPIMDSFATASHGTLKSALIACGRGQQDRATLCVEGKSTDDRIFTTSLSLTPTMHDGEPAVHLSIEQPRIAEAENEAEVLVEQTLHTDLATGFLQRRQFLELLTEKRAHSKAPGVRALAFVEPDKFAEIERDLGPVSSEEIIGQIAEVLDGLMLETDLAGRFAGKVLALVISRTSLDDVENWARNALARIGERLFEAADRSLSLTCSIGLAELGAGTERVEDLIHNAERALERAHGLGGNRLVLEETSDESTRIKRVDELRIRQIKTALVDGRFRLMHLNIASLAGQSERIYDTFIRLVDEQGEEMAATEFMESAGRSGLLRAVDRWVIDASLSFCAKQASDLVFVKLTHESVLDTSLWSWIEERVKLAKIHPSRLCFQVTEDNASRYQKQTGALAECLRRRGFRFAVENFGTGRDPFRVLGSLPLDFIKFDGSLSRVLGQDAEAQEQMRQFVERASQRSIRTIATHVENANTMALLFQLGVAYMQGHYLHEPEVVLEAAI